MAAGGIRSLISGKSDFELVTEGSQFSYFLQEFKARPKFQCQMLPFPFEGTCHYGDMYTQTLPTAGDLLTKIYLKINLPNISPSVYATSIGNYLFEYAELMVNRQVIERCYGEFNQFIQEITVPEIKQPLLSKLSGKDVQNITGSITLYIEIPFSLCERGIPMLAVAPGSFEIRIKYRSSDEFTFPPIQITDFVQGQFLMEYVYLGETEAKYFQDKKRTYLVQQTQLYQGIINPGQTTVSYPLHFIGPVKELFFFITNQLTTKNVFNQRDNYVPVSIPDSFSMCYANNNFVSITNLGGIYISRDNGITWRIGTVDNSQWYTVSYGNGYYVFVDHVGHMSYSTDNLVTITAGNIIPDTVIPTLIFANGYFVITSNLGYVLYATDPTKTWTYCSISSHEWTSITYGNGYFVVISQNNPAYSAYTTTPELPWIDNNTLPLYNTFTGLTYGNGYFLASSYNNYAMAYITDPSTTSWILVLNDNPFNEITYGNGKFIGVNDGGSFYATDITQPRPFIKNSLYSAIWKTISFGSGYFVTLSAEGYTSYSVDGITWKAGNVPITLTENLVNLQLVLDGYEVIAQDIATPLYLRGVQPMDFHTRIPSSTLFYIYSFCLDPENIEPTGHLNFGRIQQQILNMNVVSSTQSRYTRVYARSYNIFTTEKGRGQLLFNSNG